MAIKIGTYTMPTTMNNRASNYVFERAKIIGRNGEGTAIESAGGCAVLWQWSVLSQTEFAWLNTTVLNYAASATFGTAANTVLYNELGTETTFNHAIVLRPTFKALSGLTYHEVTLVIDNLW